MRPAIPFRLYGKYTTNEENPEGKKTTTTQWRFR